MATVDQLMVRVKEDETSSGNKISIIGAGDVGMACAFSLLLQKITNDISLVDVDKNKVQGEMMDLQHGASFLKNFKIQASGDYAITENSRICIITAGARQRPGDTRRDLAQRNTDIFKSIIPELVKHSPDTILLIVSNPVDTLTHVAWKLSGLPVERVIGSGTHLDSSRFKFLLSERLHLAPSSCHGWVIGEHGDTSVPIWSGVNVAGVTLKSLNKDIGTENDPENWKELHLKVVTSAYEVIKLKGYTSWAIGLSVGDICSALLRNTHSVLALTTMAKGFHGIEDEIFLSLPVKVGEKGITAIVKQPLDDKERKQLQKSAKALKETYDGIKF